VVRIDLSIAEKAIDQLLESRARSIGLELRELLGSRQEADEVERGSPEER
jgi:hypothetical protein